jgi:signal transduction histidine kinase
MNLRPDPARLVARLSRRTVRLRLTALYGGLFLASGTGLLVITNLLARGWPQVPLARIHHAHLARLPEGQIRAAVAPDRAAEMTQLLMVSVIALGIMAVASAALGWLVAGRVLRPLREMTTTARAISEDNLHQRLAVPGPGDELKDLGDTIDGLLDRLEGAFDAQRNFVASASHELRTPLTLTRTLLQMALTDPHPTLASYRSTCQDLLEASDQQEQLIEALLTLARSQRGLDHREPLDLATITTGVLHTLKPQADARGLAISTSITSAPLLGDERLLQRLVTNLISNAIRHNVPGGQISIRVTSDGGHTLLRITNTGPVIPSSQVNRLLQPFQRLPATRSADAEGLGLGLSIVAAIAKAHQATLTINPRPHGGLDIAINFPPATPATPTPSAALTTA